MAAATGTTLVLVAGTITFANEWYQTKVFNWRVPIATVLIAAGFEGLDKFDPRVATGLGIMALIVAGTTTFNGKSAADTIGSLFTSGTSPTSNRTTPKRVA
jgi:hypothetical protein